MLWRRIIDFKSKTIFLKILIMFLLVITPLCTLSLLINAKGHTAVSDEIDKSLASRSAYFVNLLGAEINRMTQHQRELILDRDLQKWAYIYNSLDRYEWGETILRIQEKMRIIKTSSIYIKSVSAQLLTTGQSISSEYALGPADMETVNAFLDLFHSTGSSIMYYKGRLLLGYVYPDAFLTKKQSDYIVFIELSVTDLQKSLMQFTNYEGAGAVLINLHQDWTIENMKDKPFIPAILQFVKAQNITEPVQFVKSLRMDSQYIVSYQYSSDLQMALLVYVPEKQVLGDLDSYRIWFWILSVVSIIIISTFSLWIYRFIHKPLNKLVVSFRKVEDGFLEPTLLPKGQDEFRYLFEHFNSMVARIKELIHKLYEQEIRTKDSELKQLQSQINPHFLYNTYFILHRLAKMDDIENVILFSQYMGEYFQFITRNNESQIPLEQEIKHARLYVEIQQIRFSNRIEVEFDPLPDAVKEVLVPKLIVQPIIENAYKYGMERKIDDGLISIKIQCDDRDDAIRIVVEDNGPGMDEEALRKLQYDLESQIEGEEITGIHNVHRRLRFLFGKESGITLSHGDNGGLRVEIAIHAGNR